MSSVSSSSWNDLFTHPLHTMVDIHERLRLCTHILCLLHDRPNLISASMPSCITIPISGIYVGFHVAPHIIDKIQVWRVWRPLHRNNPMISEIVLRNCGCMGWSIFMHKFWRIVWSPGIGREVKSSGKWICIILCTPYAPLLFTTLTASNTRSRVSPHRSAKKKHQK